MSDESPPGWILVPLGELAEVQLGKMLSRAAFVGDVVQLPYLRNENVRWSHVDTTDVKLMGFKSAEIERFTVRKGDLLVCEGGEPGRCAVFAGTDAAFMYQKALHRVRPRAGISAYYLQYWLMAAVRDGKTMPRFSETTIRHLPLEKITRLQVPLPPANQQQRIVDDIEKHFTRLEAAVAALERVKVNLKRYRASVLKAACEGRLVPTEAELARDEGRDFEPADQLLARILAERRSRWEADQLTRMAAAGKPQKDDNWKLRYVDPAGPNTNGLAAAPPGWCWATAAQLGTVQLGRQRSPKNRSNKFATPYIRAANLTWRGLDLSDVLEMDFKPAERANYELLEGDIVLSEASGSADQVGKPAVWRGQIDGCCFQNTVIRLRPVLMNSDFLHAVFWYFAASRVFSASSRGVGIHHLGAERFSTIIVPIPPLPEQQRIAEDVERLLSIVGRLDIVIEASLKRAERLRQAVLKLAFEGRLAPQDPNDEPASLLLERMRAQRAKSEGPVGPPNTLRARRGARQLPLPLGSL